MFELWYHCDILQIYLEHCFDSCVFARKPCGPTAKFLKGDTLMATCCARTPQTECPRINWYSVNFDQTKCTYADKEILDIF